MPEAITSSHPTANKSTPEYMLEKLLEKADIRINGNRPWDMQLHDPNFVRRVFALGNLGLGEGYIAKEWDAQSLDEFFCRLLRAQLDRQVKSPQLLLYGLRARLFNLQTLRRAWQVGRTHYDLGNDFYASMLDPRMTYTCGYWRDAHDLQSAQEAKLELICRKLQLEPGMTVLDVGCGWGSFMRYAAERHGVECVGITVSAEQAACASRHCEKLPIEIRLQDYRHLAGQYDRIVSIGMFEHVGHKNYREYMKIAHRCLKEDGLFLLHTIGKNDREAGSDPWIEKYIFPNGEIPSIGQIGDSVDNLFIVEDLHNFGADYDRTLMAWHANFEAAWPRFSSLGEQFHRAWRYYLLSCAGAFRARNLQLWQWVLSKNGVDGGYRRVS